MMTEAYTSLENTIKYYNYGSHIPFNFNFIMNVTAASNAIMFKRTIDEWIKTMPEHGTANWVVKTYFFTYSHVFLFIILHNKIIK